MHCSDPDQVKRHAFVSTSLAVDYRITYFVFTGHSVAPLFKALRYKSEGFNGVFHWHNPFGPTMVVGSIQPLTDMSKK